MIKDLTRAQNYDLRKADNRIKSFSTPDRTISFNLKEDQKFFKKLANAKVECF